MPSNRKKSKFTKAAKRRKPARKPAPAPRMRRQKSPPSGQGVVPDIGGLDTDDDPVPE